jgi:hypothetical protein
MPVYLVPREQLDDTPSRRAGVPQEVERTNRAFLCELICQAGTLLRL